MPEEERRLLRVDSLVTGYGKKQVLNGLTLDIAPGEVVVLIGHNGAGKSTLLKAVFGLLPVWKGQVILDGVALHSPSPRELLRSGVAYVPQGNRVFTDLTVRENLEMGGVTLSNGALLNEASPRQAAGYPTALAEYLQNSRSCWVCN